MIMVIDILAVITLIVFGIWGLRRGLIKQIAVIAAIVLCYLFSSPIADIFANIITDHSEISFPPRYLHVLLVAITATTIFVVVTLVGAFLHKTLVSGIKPVEHANKAFGFTLGFLSAGLIIYFILCIANCGSGWIKEYAPSLLDELQNSVSYTITKNFNIVEERMPELAKKTGKPADSNKVEKADTSVKDALKPVDTAIKQNIRDNVLRQQNAPESVNAPSGKN